MSHYHLDEARPAKLGALLDGHRRGLGKADQAMAQGVSDEWPASGFGRGVFSKPHCRGKNSGLGQGSTAVRIQAEGGDVGSLEVSDRALPDRVAEARSAQA